MLRSYLLHLLHLLLFNYLDHWKVLSYLVDWKVLSCLVDWKVLSCLVDWEVLSYLVTWSLFDYSVKYYFQVVAVPNALLMLISQNIVPSIINLIKFYLCFVQIV